MGLNVKKHKGTGKYKIYSSVSGQPIHENKWLSEDESKAVLIEREFYNFIKAVNEIDATFPDDYEVNGQYPTNMKAKSDYLEWVVKNFNNQEVIFKRFIAVINRVNPDLSPFKIEEK